MRSSLLPGASKCWVSNLHLQLPEFLGKDAMQIPANDGITAHQGDFADRVGAKQDGQRFDRVYSAAIRICETLA